MADRVYPEARPGVASLEGYHSPQVEVEVRLNTNESPVPPPASFTEAVAAAAAEQKWHRYPDRTVGVLRRALAESHGISPAQIFAANGSNEVIQSLQLAYGGLDRTAAIFEPTYAMYAQIAAVTGTSVISGSRGSDHRLVPGEAMHLLVEKQPNLVFLCSPNNPTGTIDPLDLISEMVDVASQYGGLVVVDEAYGQFSGQSALSIFSDDLPLVVCRTFSKTWAMAGVRLGYLAAPTWCIAELEKVVLPYHLDSLKQQIGVLALEHEGSMADRVAQLVAERERVTAAMAELPLTLWSSEANFLLFRPEAHDGRELWTGLVERSVLIRDFTTFPGLEGCLRVTIGTPHENDRFLDALRELLYKQPSTEGA